MPLLLTASAAACTQSELSNANVGTAEGPIAQVENLHYDPAAPGYAAGTLVVDPDSVADITDGLAHFLDNGGVPNARIILSPSQVFANAHPGCVAGHGRACLVLREAAAAGEFNVLPFTPTPQLVPRLENDLFTIAPGASPGTRFLLPPTSEYLPEAIDTAALQVDLGALADRIPFATQTEDYAIDVWMRGSPPSPWPSSAYDSRFVGVDADGNPDGSPLWHWKRVPGLWVDVVMSFPAPIYNPIECYCYQSPAVGWGISSSQCETACGGLRDTGLDCDGMHIWLKLNSLNFAIGFVPEIIPGCDPLQTTDPAVSFDNDPRLGWMSRMPGGRPYRQSCLRVRPVISPATVVYPEDDPSDVLSAQGSGAALSVDLYGCNTVVGGAFDGWGGGDAEAACAIVTGHSCDHVATQIGANQVQSQLNTTVVGATRPLVQRFFGYEAGADSPFAGGGDPGCNATDLDCPPRAMDHFLPASLTYMAYNWFAAPFGPVDAKPWHQYPVYKIEENCGGDSKMVDGQCRVCGQHQHWAPDCPEKCRDNGDPPTLPPFECWGANTPPGVVPSQLELQYLADPDQDGFIGTADSCPFEANPNQSDWDHDGVGDACDICPSTSNPLQNDLDLDGDGTPDACETPDQCPCDPVNNPALPQDHDGVCGYCDGTLGGPGSFCEDRCGGATVHKLDSCPAVDNPTEANCNADAEQERHAEEMGDECDPVPCPSFTPRNEGTVLQTTLDPGHSNSGAIWVDTVEWTELSSIRMSPIGAHRILGAQSDPNDPSSQPEEHLVTANSEYRACVDLPSLSVSCGDKPLIANHFINDTQNIGAETKTSIWHRVSMKDVTKPGTASDGSDWNPLDSIKYFSSLAPLDKTWSWKDDYQTWSQGWGSGVVPALPAGPDEGAGRFWIHGRTNIGEKDDPFSTGLHTVVDTDTSGMDANDYSRLVNHYEPVQPVAANISRWFKRLPLLAWPSFLARICQDCTVDVTLPSTECTSCGAFGAIKEQRTPAETQVLIALPPDMGSEVGVLRRDGQLQLVTSKLGPALRETLASDSVMLSAVEPSTSIGGGARFPAAIALSPDGTEIRDRVLQRRGGFISQHDLEKGGGDAIGGSLRAAAQSAPSTESSPAPRTGFQAVYSRAAARVFLLGGTDSSTNQPARDIWWQDVYGFKWYRVPLDGYAPEQVMAATYSYRDHQLWVLDQKNNGPFPLARLVRIDPVTGHHEVVGTWPRLGFGNNWVFDRHWLVLDRDGSVLLVASSSKVNKHVIVRIDLSGAPVVDGVQIAPFAFAAAPAVDADGYSLILEQKNKLPKLVRLNTLEAHPGRWLDLGGCL